MDRLEVIGKLRSGILEVTFTKVDLTERKMRCTLHTDHLPVTDLFLDGPPKRLDNTNQIRVWDLDKAEWRSFRLDSIITIKEEETV